MTWTNPTARSAERSRPERYPILSIDPAETLALNCSAAAARNLHSPMRAGPLTIAGSGHRRNGSRLARPAFGLWNITGHLTSETACLFGFGLFGSAFGFGGDHDGGMQDGDRHAEGMARWP